MSLPRRPVSAIPRPIRRQGSAEGSQEGTPRAKRGLELAGEDPSFSGGWMISEHNFNI